MWDSGITEAVPGADGPQATVIFKLNNAAERYSFAQQLLGQWTGSAPSNVLYTGPFEYPPSPNLLCTAIPSIESFNKKIPMVGVGLPYWFGTQCIVTALFTRPPWQAATNGAYFSLSIAGSGEMLSIPETTGFYSSGLPTNTPLGIFLPAMEITVKRFRMPFLPDTYMWALQGMLNNQPFQIGNVLYPTGCLLFMPGTCTTESDPLGNITYSAEYKFHAKLRDWNYFINPAPPLAWDLVTDGSGNPFYSYGNFNLLP